MGGDVEHFAVRTRPELRARRLLVRGFDELLHHAAHPLQLVEVLRGTFGGNRHDGPIDRAPHGAPIRALGAQDERVPLAREAVVQFDQRTAHRRPLLTQLHQRLGDVVACLHVFDAGRHLDPGLAKHAAAP